MNEQATQISLEIDGPAVYEEALKLDAQTIRELLSAKNYNELSGRIQNVEWSRFASCRDKTVSKEKIEAVKDLREQVKENCQWSEERLFLSETGRNGSRYADMSSLYGRIGGPGKMFFAKI